MIDCVLFDLDGTLADNDHRQSLLNSSKPDWELFFSQMTKDKPKIDVVKLYKALLKSKVFEVLIVTGRPERYRDITEDWLKKNGLPYSRIVMRKNGDHAPDYKVKKEMLDKLQQEGLNIIFVVDDRVETVHMWRENGITCLQCADHQF